MKAEPISLSKPGTTKYAPEVRSGRIVEQGADARRGWRVHLEGENHQVLLPTGSFRSMLGTKLEVDDAPVALPRGLGFRKTASFVVGGHPATIEVWTVFEPVRHWAGGANLRRAGLLGFLGGLLSAGVGAGLAAGTMEQRRTRELARLSVDDVPLGTWMSTQPPRNGVRWEFVAPADDLESIENDWNRTAELVFRAGSDVQTTLDDAGLARTLGDLFRQVDGRWISLEPADRRGLTISLERVPPGSGGVDLVAKIPHGPGGRRSALAGIGWAVEPEPSTGTRYFVRRFATAGGSELDGVIAELRSAYAALYGSKLRFERWKLVSGKAGSMRVDA